MKKHGKVELRYYDIPQKEGVLAMLGDDWVRAYGDGIEYLHFHNLMEIGICRWGEGTLVLNEEQHRFGPGMISVIPKNFPHTTNSDPGTQGFWEYLFFDPAFFLREHYGVNELAARRILNLVEKDAVFGTITEYSFLADVSNGIMDQMRTKERFYVDRIHGLLMSAIYEIARIADAEDDRAEDKAVIRGVGQIQGAIKYVEQHYDENIRIEQLADACHISQTHFRRLFSEAFSMTPVEYINMIRVIRACDMLRTNNDTIANVAMKCGFSSVSTFDRNFKSVIGISPNQWKKDPKHYESRLLEMNISVQKGW